MWREIAGTFLATYLSVRCSDVIDTHAGIASGSGVPRVGRIYQCGCARGRIEQGGRVNRRRSRAATGTRVVRVDAHQHVGACGLSVTCPTLPPRAGGQRGAKLTPSRSHGEILVDRIHHPLRPPSQNYGVACPPSQSYGAACWRHGARTRRSKRNRHPLRHLS